MKTISTLEFIKIQATILAGIIDYSHNSNYESAAYQSAMALLEQNDVTVSDEPMVKPIPESDVWDAWDGENMSSVMPLLKQRGLVV